MTKLIIGLTGPEGAGKGEAAKVLQKRGFKYYSCSDILRQELKRKKIEENIDNLISLGNNLRAKEGAGVLGKRIARIIKRSQGRKFVVDSLRHPQEIHELKKLSGFRLLLINAPQSTRYSRIKTRKRAGDDVSFSKFKKQEQFQKRGRGAQAQLTNCFKLADYKIYNNKTIKFFSDNVAALASDLTIKYLARR